MSTSTAKPVAPDSDTSQPASVKPVCELHQGDAPLLISLPHSGTGLSPGLRERLTETALQVPDTDWHVEKLYAFAPLLGASVLTAHLSRYVIDLNRDPSGASLYPGRDTTELCPTSTFDQDAIYLAGCAPDAAEVEARTRDYYQPYHRLLAGELERLRARHGYVLLLDGHSIRSEVSRFFDGRLPDLNLGSADGHSAAPALEQAAVQVLAASGMSWVCNGRFKGGFITRHYGDPSRGVHALQLEMAQVCYMQEGAPFTWSAESAAALVATLQRLVEAMLNWSPLP